MKSPEPIEHEPVPGVTYGLDMVKFNELVDRYSGPNPQITYEEFLKQSKALSEPQVPETFLGKLRYVLRG